MEVSGLIPSIQRICSFLYLLSPLEFILIAGSLPRLPQRFMVRGETLKRSAASPTVSKSGRLSSFKFFFCLIVVVFSSMSDIEVNR